MPPSLPLLADQGLNYTSFSTQSASNGDAISMIFGIFAVLASGITIWQGHKAWKLWREHHPQSPIDLELGGPPPPPRTSPDPPVTPPSPPKPVSTNEHDGPVPPVSAISESSLTPTASSSTQAQRGVPLAALEIRSSRSPESASSEPPDTPSLPVVLSSHNDDFPHPD